MLIVAATLSWCRSAFLLSPFLPEKAMFNLATNLKYVVKRIVPKSLMVSIRKMMINSKLKKYEQMGSNEAVFDKVYTDLTWQEGTDSESASGDGSDGLWLDETVKFLETENLLSGRKVLEIGCGDFSFGSKVCHLAEHYTGVDVSTKIIGQNKERYVDLPNVVFMQKDATEDSLPSADVVIIRQVLQHLPNAMIIKILDQVEQMEPQSVVVFEDVPSGEFEPNKDLRTAGPYTRHLYVSGVDLSKPPFSRDFKQTREWLHPKHPRVAAKLVCYQR